MRTARRVARAGLAWSLEPGAWSLIACLAAVTVGACADPRYCDEDTPCNDPAYPHCVLAWHECEATAGPDDGGVIDGPVLDGGCPAGRHLCGESCVADDDPQHCGAACVACSGGTPACAGGTCSCTATSCSTGEVCAGGACVSGTCTTAAECRSPPPCRVAAGAGCNPSHLCVYPLAAAGATCSTGHCCAGACVPNAPAQCGPTCVPCGAVTGGTATCDGTACGYTCNGGYYDSGTACAACDVPDHCGASCASCPAVTNADRTCAAACGYACHGGFYDTGAACAACEVDDHCGPSCLVCAGTTPTCLGPRCGCTPTSCGTGTTPICDDASKACRGCAAHGECASGACDFTAGACVAATDVIYVDKNAVCAGGDGGAARPFCDFPPALAAVTAGAARWRIVMQPGVYSYSAAQVVQDRKAMVIGAGTGATELVQNAANTPVLQVLGTGDLSLYHVVVRGATGATGHGILCAGTASIATLLVDGGDVHSNNGIGISASACTLTLSRSVVAVNNGGGVSVTNGNYTIVNCLIVRNGGSAGTNTFGGFKVDQPGLTAVFINNTVADNAASASSAAGVRCIDAASVVNSIVWGNTGGGQQSGCTITYSDVQGGVNGTGNIDADPKFVDQPNLNYHLVTTAPASLCINAGTTASAPTGDLDGNRRTTTPDLGCYEAQ